jgi:FtsH-binding integral membrane protein
MRKTLAIIINIAAVVAHFAWMTYLGVALGVLGVILTALIKGEQK